jgi:DNA-directed RNA polymerase specialized sigma24 family protein
MADWLSSSAGGGLRFETTQWSLVAAAGADEEKRPALQDLYRSYAQPIYAFIRRRGYSRQDAQDLTQDFFLHLLEKNTFSRADRLKGKFRSFLLGALEFFLSHANERATAEKRGGHATLVFLDDENAEVRYQLADPGQTAEQLFDARWAATLIETTVDRLKAENEAAGKGELFNHIRGFLIEGEDSSYAEVAERTGLTLGAVRLAIHRLRSRYRELLRAEIARTVVSSDDFDEEVRALRASLQRGYVRGT